MERIDHDGLMHSIRTSAVSPNTRLPAMPLLVAGVAGGPKSGRRGQGLGQPLGGTAAG